MEQSEAAEGEEAMTSAPESTCRRCEELLNEADAFRSRINLLEDVLSDSLDFLLMLEVMTRAKDSGTEHERSWRKELASTIEQARKLA